MIHRSIKHPFIASLIARRKLAPLMHDPAPQQPASRTPELSTTAAAATQGSSPPARQPRPPRRASRRPSPAAWPGWARRAWARRPVRRGLLALAVAGVPAALVLMIASNKGDVVAVFDHLRDGDGWWLAVAGAFEAVSFGGYITLFHTVIDADERRIGWTTGAQITLAGVVATRIFAAAGAGGLTLSTWALHAAGMDARTIARRMIALLLLSYNVFCTALLIAAALLAGGAVGVHAPLWLTIPGLLVGGGGLASILAVALVPGLQQHLSARARRGGRWHRRLLAILLQGLDGAQHALSLVRRRDPRLAGAIVYWAGDAAVLWRRCTPSALTPRSS